MDSINEPDCRKCPMHTSCRTDSGDELSGWPLAGQAMAYFLLPLVAAIAAAAAARSENMRILAGVVTFVLTAAATAIIGLWIRRRRKEPQ